MKQNEQDVSNLKIEINEQERSLSQSRSNKSPTSGKMKRQVTISTNKSVKNQQRPSKVGIMRQTSVDSRGGASPNTRKSKD